MPRITECLAARQEVAPDPGKPCSFGCTGLCLGPRCPELVANIDNSSRTVDPDTSPGGDNESVNETEDVNTKTLDPNEQFEEDYSATDDATASVDYDSYDDYQESGDVGGVTDEDSVDDETEYVDYTGSDYDDYEDYDSFAEVETPVDLPLGFTLFLS